MNLDEPYFQMVEDAGERHLRLSGSWDIDHSEDIETALKRAKLQDMRVLDASAVGRMDVWGSLRVQKLAEVCGARLYLSDRQQRIFSIISESGRSVPRPPRLSFVRENFQHVGRKAVEVAEELRDVIIFIGEISACFARNLANPRAFRFHSIVRHIDETGFRALPIIGLLAVLISMVISYQASMQLARFGANIFTIDLTVISLLREMGVLVTAIMVAGRSGSAFAAEIGVMKLREEIDALKTMGMNPIEILIIPRLIAMMLTLPLLTFLADIIGLAGGGIISVFLLDIPLEQYINRVQGVATTTMFFVGIVKAPVFAFVITVVGCYQGMNVTGSAESVGRLTTVSVVQSIFLVIMIDALFSLLFVNLGI